MDVGKDEEEDQGFRVNNDAPTSIIGLGRSKSRLPSAGLGAATKDDDDHSWIPMKPHCTCFGPRALWVHPEPYFHFAMALGAMYLGMTLTNWGRASSTDSNTDFNLSYAAVWIKMSHIWLCTIVFLWILIIPVVCFKRDFTKECKM